jgi:hypothetical protein
MMNELTSNLGFNKENYLPYYPQANDEVEVSNKSLKNILQWKINSAKLNWNLMLYSTLWAYLTSVKTDTGFSHFQLVYGMEATFPIECHIPSLKLAVELLPDTTTLEEHLIYLEQLNEQCHDESLANEAHKQHVKCQYDWSVHPRFFSEGDLFLVYNQDKDLLGEGKFKPMWFRLFIIKKFLGKCAYELVDFEGNNFPEPINGIYLKKYYS